jgi:hypothetical protein
MTDYDVPQSALVSYLSREQRVSADHRLSRIRGLTDQLASGFPQPEGFLLHDLASALTDLRSKVHLPQPLYPTVASGFALSEWCKAPAVTEPGVVSREKSSTSERSAAMDRFAASRTLPLDPLGCSPRRIILVRIRQLGAGYSGSSKFCPDVVESLCNRQGNMVMT